MHIWLESVVEVLETYGDGEVRDISHFSLVHKLFSMIKLATVCEI